MEFQNGFSFGTNLKLVKVSTDNKDELLGNRIKKLWLRSAVLYFAQRIFIWRTEFQNGFSFCMDVELIK